MPITVDVPELGAEVEFPDGMSHDDIASAITKHITGFKDLSKDQPLTLRPPRVTGPSTTAGGPPLATPDIGQVMAQTGELAEQAHEIASKPTLPDLPLGPSESFLGGLAKGGVKAAYGIPQFLSSPIGATAAAVAPAAPLASTIGFSGIGLEGVRESLKNISENWDKMTSGERGESISSLLASMAMFGLPAKAAVNMIRGKVPGVAASRILDEAIKDYKPRETPAVPPVPVREQGMPAAPPEGMVGLKDLTPQQEIIQKTAPILPRAAKEAAVSVEEQARLQKELAEELGQETTKKEGEAHSSDLAKAQAVPVGKPFYYGDVSGKLTTKVNESKFGDYGKGKYVTPDPNFAKQFAEGTAFSSKPKGSGKVHEVEFEPPKNVFSADSTPLTADEIKHWSDDGFDMDGVQTRSDLIREYGGRNYGPDELSGQSEAWDDFLDKFGYDGVFDGQQLMIRKGDVSIKPPPTPASVKAEPSGRDWDAFTEELIGELDSFSPARHTGRENYELNDVADRFAQFAKADTSGKPLDKLVSDFSKVDEASQSQIRKLRQGVKSLLAQEKLAEPSAPPPPAQPKGETGGKVPASVHKDPSGKPVEASSPETGRQYFRQDPDSGKWMRVRYEGISGKMDQHQIHEWTWLEGPQKGSKSSQYGQGGFFAAKSQVAEPYVPEHGTATDRFRTEQELRNVRSQARTAQGNTRTRLNEKARLLAERLKQIDAYAAEEEAKAKSPPTPPPVEQKGVGPATGEGPGATVAGPTGIDPKAQIEQLADSFRNIEGQKLAIGEKLKQAFQVGERLSGAKDALSKALDGLKSTGNYLIGKWNQVQNIDDLLRAKGDLSAALETRGWRVRQWEKLARKATPSLRDQAAIAKYVDAGGDMAELQRGFTEAPPKYKQAYQDAMNLKGDLKIAAENIRNYFDSRLQEAIDAGVLEHGVEDYIHRIYESKPKVAKQLYAYVQTGLLQKNPALTKKRIFQFDWEAEKLGYKPVQSYIPRIAQYESSLARAIAAREFIKKATTMRAADGRPVIDIKGVGIPIEDPSGVREATLIKPQFNPANKNQPGTPNYRGDYVNKEFPALSRWKWVAQDSNGKPIFVQGDVAIHPDYVNRVAALLEPSRVRYGRYGAVARPALNIGSAVKQTMLDLSGFHQVQTTVHGLEHRINPLNLVQEIDFNNPDVDGLLKGGVTLGGDYRMQAEGLAGQALTRHIPFLGPALESYHQWLFQDYIPRLKMTMALHALERNKARYSGVKSPEEIYHQTASESNAAFGEQNYIMLERSKTAQDMARLILLAPDFLEARGRFAGQALTKGGKAFGNEQRTALLLGALTMYVTARILNKATTGQYHNEPENLFSVVHNGKAYGLRTVQGDILHLIEHPLQFWMHRLNPVFGRTTLEMATGRDEFGRKRSMPEQLWDFASTVMPISLRTSRERSIWESLANSFGINARRWQDTDDAFKLAKDWKDKHGIGERGEFIYDRDKDPLRPLKLALTSQDEGAAVKEIKKLIQSKTYTIPKLNDYFRRYASMPFTGSRANDVAWKRTLSEDQLKTVDAAKQHKESIRQLYMKALAKVYAD